jgi:hypothetical protein
LGKEPDVGACFAEGCDGLIGKLDVVVAVGSLDVLVLQEGGGGQEDVGVVGRVGEELLVDDCEEIGAGEPAQDRGLIP